MPKTICKLTILLCRRTKVFCGDPDSDVKRIAPPHGNWDRGPAEGPEGHVTGLRQSGSQLACQTRQIRVLLLQPPPQAHMQTRLLTFELGSSYITVKLYITSWSLRITRLAVGFKNRPGQPPYVKLTRKPPGRLNSDDPSQCPDC